MPTKKDERRSPKRPAAKKKIAAAAKKPAMRAAPATRRGPLSGTIKPGVDLGLVLERVRPQFVREFRIEVRRPLDFAVFDVVFLNLRLDGQTLVRREPERPAHIVLEFPPQSFGEQAFLDATGPEVTNSSPPYPPSPGPVNKNVPGNQEPLTLPAKIRMAGPSRLAFTMPDDLPGLAFTLDAIMSAVRTWKLRLDAIAAPEPIIIRPTELPGKKWLKEIVSAPQWSETSSTIGEALAARTRPEIGRFLGQAAARIANTAVEGLAAQAQGLDRRVQEQMNAELAALAERFPELREGELRETASAALAIRATESLAAARGRFGEDVTFVPVLPFLPIVLSPHAPSKQVTALELPYRVVISPIENARWTHRDAAFTNPRTGRTELWHTRLTTASDDFGPDAPSKFRAIWSPDYPIEDFLPLLSPQPRPFRMSTDPLDRRMLVQLMAGYNETAATSGPARAYVPRPSVANRLTLSALGGLLDSEGNWPRRPLGVGLEQWRHLASLGRDHYVRVVYAGFLMPFGHAASLVKVTERKFESVPGTSNRVAVLRQRFFIIVREREKSYPAAGTAAGWFNYPLRKVEILTRVTPNLVAPEKAICKVDEAEGAIYGGTVPPRAAFWPMIAETSSGDFRFEIAVTDIAGARSTFAMPLLFIGDEANQAKPENVVKGYNRAAEVPRRNGTLGGSSVCFAPVQPGAEGDPRLPAASLSFSAVHFARSAIEPRFNPQLQFAEVGIRQIQRLLGQSQATVRVEYADVYKTAGFGGANKGEIFLKLVSPYELNFGGGASQAKSDALGALASPAMAIQGLSRVMGPVSAKPPSGSQTVEQALGKVIGNKFDPTDFFRGAKILGGIDLSTVLDVVNALTGADVPKMVSRELPDRIEASFHWETRINKSDPLKLLVPNAGGATMLTMDGRMSAPIADPAASTFTADAKIVHFKVNLFGFIIIWFDSLSFKAARGKKPDVAVEIHPGDEGIAFGGPLEFVNELRKFIPSNGFSDPPSLSVTPSGIAASYSLSLPSIQVGIFALSNVSLGAGFALPFDSKPVEVKFNFCERHSPFSLTVSMLGGGGFFAIGIGTEGVREIEAALEFGAELAIDLGVASGKVEIKAGVYFHWLESGSGKTVELTGYIRLHGELSVLGLISASLTFNLQLSYLKQGNRSSVWGEATLTVEIEILFFSASVSVKCRREFGGSPSDPTFLQLIPDQPVWSEYCLAFAEEEA